MRYTRLKDMWMDERGMLMVFSLMIVLLISLLGGIFLTTSQTEQRISYNERIGTDVLYVSETGWNFAICEMSATNFQGATHYSDGVTPVVPPTLGTTIPNAVIDDITNELDFDDRNNGDWVWQWSEGKFYDAMTSSGMPEQIRIKIYFVHGTDPPQFVIRSEGSVGTYTKILEIRGFTEALFNYSIYDAGDLSEFVRGRDQTINGKIHANGNIYFRPSGTTLQIDSNSLTCAGSIIRSEDAWGRPHESGTVMIKDGDGVYQEMGVSPFFDSSNPDWTDNDPDNLVEGALEKWDGIVRDGLIGGHVVEPPAIEEDGFYNQNCGIRITGTSIEDNDGNDISGVMNGAISTVDFYNPGMYRYVTVRELDMAKLRDPNDDGDYSDSNFPENGLLFSTMPLRMKNCSELDDKITIVSTNSIYTWGDFNNIDKKPAALISRGRLWHLSGNWNDSQATNPLSSRKACDTEIYAALVDGVPTIDEANYAGGVGNAVANADDLLEDWVDGGRILSKRGAIVHLQNADMCDVVPNDPGPDEIGWRVTSQYGAAERDYAYDSDLCSPAGQPPYIPYGGHLFSWREID